MSGSVSSAFTCPHQDCADLREALSAQASAALGLGPALASTCLPACWGGTLHALISQRCGYGLFFKGDFRMLKPTDPGEHLR